MDYLNDDNSAKPRHIFRLLALGEKPIPVHQEAEQKDDAHEDVVDGVKPE